MQNFYKISWIKAESLHLFALEIHCGGVQRQNDIICVFVQKIMDLTVFCGRIPSVLLRFATGFPELFNACTE